MDEFIALGTPRPSAGHERDVPVKTLPAHRAGRRLDLQRLGFDALFDPPPSHCAAQYRQDEPFAQGPHAAR